MSELIWAQDASASEKLAPSAEKIVQGWNSETPPHEWFNWYMNRTDTRLSNMEDPLQTYMQRWTAGSRDRTILAKERFDLPVKYEVGSNQLRVYLDGILCEPGEDAQYVECGTPGTKSAYIRWNDDIDVNFDIRIEVPIRAMTTTSIGDEALLGELEDLKTRVANLEQPTYCYKFDSPANTRENDILAGQVYVLPYEYMVATNQLQVYVDGILQYETTDYEELGIAGDTTTDIKFLKDIPVSSNIRVYIAMRNGESYTVLSESLTLAAMHKFVKEHLYREQRQDTTVTERINANADFAVPEYTVGTNTLKVYKNGLLMVEGRDYAEDSEDKTTSTNIFWLSDVMPGTLITVLAPVFMG